MIGSNGQNLEGKIIVHITGAVQKTGILVLEEGARIADAIDKANGIKEDADLDEINLAYILQDGQKIYIPSKKDKAKIDKNAYITSDSGNNVIIETIEESSKKQTNQKVNINTATISQLQTLPGIGQSTANKIIEYRTENQGFKKIEELKNVKGIGDAKYEKIKEYIKVK